MNEMLFAGMNAEMHRAQALRDANDRRLLRSQKQANRGTDATRDETTTRSWSRSRPAEARS